MQQNSKTSSEPTTRVAVIGASRLGQMIAHYAVESGLFSLAGFFDNAIPQGTRTREGIVLGVIAELRDHHAAGAFDGILIGVGYRNQRWRQRFFEEFQDLELPNLIHPSAYVNETAVLGRGVVVLPRAVIDMYCEIGDNVFFNPGAIVAHDSKVGNHCFLAPGVNVSGYSTIGNNSFLGIGSSVANDVEICEDCVLGAGTVVTASLEKPGTYVGTPARLLHEAD